MVTTDPDRRWRQRVAAATLALLAVGGAAVVVTMMGRSPSGVAPADEDVSPSGSTRRPGSTLRRERLRAQPTAPAEVEAPTPAVAVDSGGNPLPGVPEPYGVRDAARTYYHVSAVAADGTREVASLRPDHQGRFILPEDARGILVRLFAMSDGTAPVVLEHPEAVRWSEIEGRSVSFTDPGASGPVTIRCVDDTGVGIRARVSIEKRFGDGWRTLVEAAETDEDGRLETVVNGTGEFRALLVWVATRSKKFVRPPEQPFSATREKPSAVEFVLPRAAELVATAVDEYGRALPDVLIGLSVLEQGRFRPHPGSGSQMSDAEGRATIHGIEPGAAIVRATKLGRVPIVRRCQLAPGVHNESFCLVRGGSWVSGRFTGLPNGLSTPEHTGLHLLRVGDSTLDMMTFPGVRLAADCSVDVDGVPPGRYQLTLMPPNRQAMIWFSVAERDTDLGAVDLGGVFAEGSLVMNVRVEASEPSRDAGPIVLYRNEAWTADVWRPFDTWLGQTRRLERLTEGTYRLRLSPQAHDPDAWDLTDTARVTVKNGETSPTVVLHIRRK